MGIFGNMFKTKNIPLWKQCKKSDGKGFLSQSDYDNYCKIPLWKREVDKNGKHFSSDKEFREYNMYSEKTLEENRYYYQKYGNDFSDVLNNPNTSKKEREFINKIMS